MAATVIGAAGSFAAIAVILGSPLVAAFLLMEAAGLGGGMLSIILVPGLLAAGIGSLIFVGLDSWVGFGTFTLAVSPIPHGRPRPRGRIPVGPRHRIGAAVVGTAIRWARCLPPGRRPAEDGAAHAGGRIGHRRPCRRLRRRLGQVLERGALLRAILAPLAHPAFDDVDGWRPSVLLVTCKGLAYGMSLSSFRGGPTFPGMFIGAAGGIALAHGPGLPMIAGAAMGMGAMTVVMLGLPLTSVLIVAVFLRPTAPSCCRS